jgi:CRISPR system Cascade subunit CasB
VNAASNETGEVRFVQQIAGWSTSGRTGSLAELRRSLSRPPGQDPASLRLVLPLIHWVSEYEEWRYLLIAGLVALEPSGQLGANGDGPNLGSAFRQLAQTASEEATERRLIRLLDADQAALPHHLRQSIRQLNSAGVPWDAARLLSDLRFWTHPDRFVQRAWARSFWGATQSTEAS